MIVIQHLLIYFIITPYFCNILVFIKHISLFDFHKSILSHIEIKSSFYKWMNEGLRSLNNFSGTVV